MSGISISPTELTIRLTAATVAGSFTLPAAASMKYIFVRNNTANSITGGLKFGTSSGGVDVMAALTIGSNAYAGSATLITGFQSTSRSIFYDAVTLWNSASVDIVIVYDQIF